MRSKAARRKVVFVLVAGLVVALIAGCGSSTSNTKHKGIAVVTTTSFLRDIVQNVAGERLAVAELVPIGVDPHEWQPAPSDLAKVSRSDVLVVNGGGLEGTLLKSAKNAGSNARIVIASAGLKPRVPKAGEPEYGESLNVDSHWWLDPVDVITYVRNIRDALTAADPSGAKTYRTNAAAYTKKLELLDAWILAQVAKVPPENRLLVMNHLSHGYFADRYGFKVVGAVIPSVTTGASVTPAGMTDLVRAIERLHVKAVFVEIEENPKLADQIASAAHIRVVTDLLDHSLTPVDGPAPDYIAMMKYDTRAIVDNLR